MAWYLTKSDLTPPLYPEIIEEITRSTDSIVDNAIGTAILEVQGYLTRFDILALTGTIDTAPTKRSVLLDSKIKDIACWQLIKLANPNVNIELFEISHTKAIKFLTEVQKGLIDPPFPLKPDDPSTTLDDEALVSFRADSKRQNRF